MGQQPEGKTLESHLEASQFSRGLPFSSTSHASVTREAPRDHKWTLSCFFQHSSPWVHGLSSHHQVEISTHAIKSMISDSLLKAHKVCFKKTLSLILVTILAGDRIQISWFKRLTGFIFRDAETLRETKSDVKAPRGHHKGSFCFLGTARTESIFRSPVRMGAEKEAVLIGSAPSRKRGWSRRQCLPPFSSTLRFPGCTFH